MRAVIYARYSSDQQRDASIEDQMRICRVRAEREGWNVVETFADHALSGATTLRPGYQAMLAHVRAGGADVLLAESLDRFSRDQEHVAAFYKQVSFAGVRIITLAEGEVSELHIGLKGTMGALYLKDLAAKTRRGLEGRIRQGRGIGTPPYGYRVVRALTATGELDRGLRAIEPDEAAIVQRIFAAYAAGVSPWRIATQLNHDGIAGPGGGIWYDSTIRGRPMRGDGLLRNPIYVGQIVWSRRHSAKDPMTGKTVRRYNPPEAVVTQAVPEWRIIDQPLWDRVQQRLLAEAAPKRHDLPEPTTSVGRGAQVGTYAHGKRPAPTVAFWDRRRPRYLLSGKVFCGCCGRPAAVFGQDYLGCRAGKHGSCRNTRTIRRSKLEAQVFGALGRQLMQPEHLGTFITAYNEEWQRQIDQFRGQVDARRRERAGIERRIGHLVDAIADGRAQPSLLAKLTELEAQLACMQAGEIEATALPPALHPGIATIYRQKVERLQETMAEHTDPEALEAARALIDKVLITPPETDTDQIGVELVGDLVAMLRAGLARETAAPVSYIKPTDALDTFVSSLKEVPGAEPPPCFLPPPIAAPFPPGRRRRRRGIGRCRG